MPMYNLLECSDNNSITSGRLSNYYTDEVNDDENKNENKYKIKITEKTPDNTSRLDKEILFH